MPSTEENIRLRPLRDEDLASVRDWRNFPATRKNMFTSHEISEGEHHSWWTSVKNAKDKRNLIYEVDAIALGVVSFYDISEVYKTAFWAFYASPGAKRGTGSLMELCALDYAFFELKLHKLCCEVLAFNSNVIKLHQKYGFAIEGQFREQYFRDGQRHDIVRLGILANEWIDGRDEIKDRLRVSKEYNQI